MHEDPLDTCPFDPVHRILRSRMPYHLLRCGKNFPGSNMKQCPFDARHLVKALEFNHHVSSCPARENVVHYRLQDEEASRYQNILPIETKSVALAQATTHKSWDDEPEVKTYNPANIILNRPIVRTMVGLSKSKRRQFRMEERRRHQELEAQNSERRQKLAAQLPSIKVDDIDHEYKPLRRPKKLSETLNSSALSLNGSVSAAGERPLQQTKSMPESQAKANTSAELNVINERQEKIPGQAQKSNANDNEYKPLRRPHKPLNDTLNVSERSTLQKKPNFANASASSISSKSARKADTPAPNAAPFTYAAALSSRNVAKNADNIILIVQEERYDSDKENTIDNSMSRQKRTEVLLGKLTKSFNGLEMDDAAHDKKTEELNKEIEKLKNLKKNSDSRTGRKIFKRDANFK